MKAAFYTLGCKVNQYESQAMSEELKNAGYEIVDADEQADVYVINSCTVTAQGDKKSRQAVRHFKQKNPDSIVVLTGCMSQAQPECATDLPQADIVMGNKTNIDLLQNINRFTGEQIVDIKEHNTGDEFICQCITHFEQRTRAEVKIEDGCNRFCSYCLIPFARGRVRSKPIDKIKAECETLADNGYKEIVLVGINLSAYEYEGKNLADAVEVIQEIKNIERIRLGSLEPDHMTADVIKKLSHQRKLCPQFHISLQSGCNKTLKKMNRHYTAEEYFILCENLRKNFSDCTLTTDIMVGFPGETDEDFCESLEFVKKIGFEKVHIFPYSRRKGTAADKYANQVSSAVKIQRAKIMSEETDKIREKFLLSQVGKKLVILTQEYKDGYTEGYTANYIPIFTEGKVNSGELIEVKAVEYKDGRLIAKKNTENR